MIKRTRQGWTYPPELFEVDRQYAGQPLRLPGLC
jgi:hypothetical protein